MADSSDEKTEQATPKRLREAREKGQIPKSKDIPQVFILITVFGVMAMTLSYMGGEFKKFFQLSFEAVQVAKIDGPLIWNIGKAGVLAMAKALAPIFAAGMFVAYITNLVQVGGLFTTDPLSPKFEKLNPIEGIKNMFKVITLIELVKNVIKITIVLYMAYSIIYKKLDAVMRTYKVDILDSASIAGGIIMEFVIKVSVLFIFISMVDYMFQRWNFMKNMRMSKDEVKREYKQEEGDPQLKGERRRLHREMAFGDVRQAVKKSDVVVTNPTHLAVALAYNREEMGAPQIAAKGQEQIAEFIVETARQEGIPIMRDIPLAWSLIHLEIGDEIPEEVYEAVAEVLTLVYEMKHDKGKAAPQPPTSPPPHTMA